MLVKVKSRVEGYNGISANLKFVKGEAEGEISFSTHKWLIKKGYVVEILKEDNPTKTKQLENIEKQLIEYTIKDLLEIAKNEGLTIEGNPKKAEIIEVIEGNRKKLIEAAELEELKKQAEFLKIEISEDVTIEEIRLLIETKQLENQNK